MDLRRNIFSLLKCKKKNNVYWYVKTYLTSFLIKGKNSFHWLKGKVLKNTFKTFKILKSESTDYHGKSYHSLDADQHRSEHGADGEVDVHGPIVEVDQPQTHDELCSGVLDGGKIAGDDADDSDCQQVQEDQDDFYDCPVDG